MTETTRDGRRLNVESGLCADCSNDAAQTAVYWTDDAKFPGDDFWTTEQRFLQIQREITDARRRCVEMCGRRALAPAPEAVEV